MTDSERSEQAHNGTMSASALGNTGRGQWEMTLLLILVLTACLAGNVLCQTDEDTAEYAEEEYFTVTDVIPTDISPTDLSPSLSPVSSSVTDGSGSGDGIEDPSSSPTVEDGLSPIIILVPVVSVIVIIAFVVAGILINRRLNRKMSNSDQEKEDPYLDGSSSEKVPMPMFEEDVPSVQELEMDDLEQWMNKDCGGGSGPV